MRIESFRNRLTLGSSVRSFPSLLKTLFTGAVIVGASAISHAATLEFNGVNQYVVATAPNLNVATNITLEAWVKPQSATANTILTRGGGSTSNTDFICSLTAAGNLAFWGVGIWDYSIGTVPLNEWVHVAVTYDGLEKKFFINGVLDHTVSRPGQLFQSSDTNIWIGRQGSGAGNFFDGELDEVRVWDIPNSGAAIAILRGLRIPAGYAGLVAYYPMDEGTGLVTADASGNDRTGRLINGPIWNIAEDAVGPAALTETATLVTDTSVQLNGLVNTNGAAVNNQFEWGAASTALDFNGANQHLTVTAPDLILTSNVTFEAWVKRDGSSYNTILSRGHGFNNGVTDFIFRLQNTGQVGLMGVNAWDLSNGIVPLNEWTHVAVTYDGLVKKFYINGLLDRVVSRPGQLYQSNDPLLYVGRQGSVCNCHYFDGEMDEVRIWNSVRTGSEIMANASETLSGDELGLAAYYPMDEGIGPFTADVSGNGNTGMFVNYPAWSSGARPVFDQVTAAQPVEGTNSVLNLDGVDDHVTLDTGVNLANQSFTLECWAKRGDANNGFQFLFAQGTPAQNQLLHVGFNANKATFRFFGNGLDTATTFTDSDWHHWAFTYNSIDRSRTIFRDGVVVGHDTASANYQGSGALFLGRYNTSDFHFNGQMDDVRIWNVARTPDQIRQFSAVPVSPDDPNLLLNYRFDEPSGTVAVDSRSNSPQDGNLVNGADRRSSIAEARTLTNLDPGKVYHYRSVAQNAYGIGVGQAERFVTPSTIGGTALDFDGVNDHVRIAGFGKRLPTTEVTVEFWQRVHSAKSQSTFRLNGNQFNGHVPWFDGRIYWEFGGIQLDYLPTVPIVGTWQHFAFVSSVSGDYMRIYRNGLLEAERVGAASFSPSALDLFLGSSDSGGFPFDGELDEFRIWNMARTLQQIQTDTSGSLTGNEPGLVAYYRMDEGAGATLLDASTNVSHGRLVNSPLRVPSTIPVNGVADAFTNANTITLIGYQPFIKQVATPPFTNLVVGGLSGNINPAAGTPGVEFTDANAGLNLNLNYTENFRTVRTSGENAAGLLVRSGGVNGLTGESGDGDGDPGQRGADAGTSAINSTGAILTTGNASAGVLALSNGGRGGNGGNGENRVFFDDDGGYGGEGGNGGAVLITGDSSVTTLGADSIGVLAISQAGRGGDGGEGHGDGDGGDGSVGGDAGTATADGSWSIRTLGESAYGIGARSLGGGGGRGNEGGWIDGDGGLGGGSGDGSTATVIFQPGGSIETDGLYAHGIFAQSIGGFAGTGGEGGGIVSSSGGNGGSAGNGGNVVVTNQGVILTRGQGAHAVFAESVGGGGGAAGSGSGLFSGEGENGNSSAGGNAGQVIVRNEGELTTLNNFSRGIFAQSVGGSGGDGPSSSGLFYSVGGAGGKGGDGDFVDVQNDGSIVTAGNDAVGLFAQSVGGGGGTGGGAASVGAVASVSIGGRGGDGGDGASVNVDSGDLGTIDTTGNRSHGIFAQSVGGGGGNGGFAVAAASGAGFSVAVGSGGAGGGGGSASNVVVASASDITTGGTNAHAIVAQSVGGGGGSGGFSIAVSGGGGMSGAISVGGGAGGGGDGQEVSLNSTGAITTGKDRSYGLLAQSVGGGGGDGGFSIAGAAGAAGLAASLGGSGGLGGKGSTVALDSSSHIQTAGSDAHGIVAQSVGGGGGSGGFSIASAAGGAGALSASLGGSGGDGGSADTVTVNNWNTIETSGRHSYGILAQSVGGGGGDGGFSIAGTVSKGPALAFSMGGSGGMGGTGDHVDLINDGNIFTGGELAHGIMAQSVGGGGGSGGFSVSAALSLESGGLGFSMGGAGGSGVEAGTVTVDTGGSIETIGKGSHAVFAQSVGGGGGSGGFAGSLAGGFGNGANLSVAIGGAGGTGGASERVTVTNRGELLVRGEGSSGIYAQSVGGGGGDGGDSLAASFGTGAKSVNMSVAIGGTGGDGGIARQVDVLNFSLLSTTGRKDAHGIFAQSIGGGGGNGGFAASGTLSTSSTNKQISVSIGGSGGMGGVAGGVDVLNTSLLTTIGDDSAGIHAQSIGGGGGNGGASFSGSFTGTGTKNVSVSLGGNGGTGGDGSSVNVMNNGGIQTSGDRSRGIFAHSIGGGGGNGAWSAALNMTLATPDTKSTQIAISVGGKGGAGGIGGDVLIEGGGDITTDGSDSEGIFAQSVGGGGGNGGVSLSGNAVLGAGQTGSTNVAWSVAVGGEGGIGNRGGTVDVDRSGKIETLGDGSHAIFGQSVGGGGGTGGSARSVNLFLKAPGATESTNSRNVSRELSLGGSGGDGGVGGSVGLTNAGSISTEGGDAHGIFAQSVGGGGGAGGNGHRGINNLTEDIEVDGQIQAVSHSVQAKSSGVELNLGGSGGGGNDGGTVAVDQTGDITTLSSGSYGILAQSIGAGGGVGGNGILNLNGNLDDNIRLSGENEAEGNGSNVAVAMNGKVDTTGAGSHGIFAQSVGGGGGVAGNVVHGFRNTGSNVGYDTSFIGEGGGGVGSGGMVMINSSNNIVTRGAGASGIFAQSVGGGGGVAGSVLDGNPLLDFAGSVGGAGSGGAVIVSHAGNITTADTSAHGIYAQSAGGIGTGNTVDVSLEGQIVISGDGSDGIFAQSRGNHGAGDVSVTIQNGGSVQGGIGMGAGVRIVDGVNNMLHNRGTVSSLGGSAIMGGSGNETVQNYGQVIGSVDLGAGQNAFNNYQGATLNLGSAGTLTLGSGNKLENAGLFTGSGQVIGDVTSSGDIKTGNSTGSLSIDGGLSLTESAGMFFDIAGTQKGISYDHLEVTSFVDLAGTLSLSLDNNFIPSSTDSFTLLNFDSATGLFGNAANGARLSTADNLASFQVNYTATTVEVSGYESPDTDGDGMTDYEESLAGTDRLSDTSVLAFSAVARNTSGDVLMQFPRVAGKTYVIEYTDDLASGIWSEVTSLAFTFPDAETAQWVDDGTQTGGLGIVFYRVKLSL